MEGLWSGTDSGLSKDWDDEFDDLETHITYNFPYSELASKSGISPVLSASESIFAKKDEVKDGNILKSRKTYSKERKNALYVHNEVSQCKKRKENNSIPESKEAKSCRIEKQKKKSPNKQPNKSLNLPVGNHSNDSDSPSKKAKTIVTFKNSPKKELVNGVKSKSIHNEELNPTTKYSLFGDVDGFSNLDPMEESVANHTESNGISLKKTLNNGYQRTRKNLKQKIDSKILLKDQSLEKKGSVVNVTNSHVITVKNADNSRSALEVKKERQGFVDSNHSGSCREDKILNSQSPPPKKQLSLLDMVRKYSEIQNCPLNKNDNARKGKKESVNKSQNSKIVMSTFEKPTIDANNKNCSNSFQNDKNPLRISAESPQTLNRNEKELSSNNILPKVYPVSQLSSVNINQPAVNSKKCGKKGKTPPKKKQTRKTKSVPKSKTECKINASSLKLAQPSVSKSIIPKKNSVHNSSQSAQLFLNSSVHNRVSEKISVSQIKATENRNHLSTNSVISQCSQIAEENHLLHQNIKTLVPVSFPLPTGNIKSQHPVESSHKSSMSVANTTKINVCIEDIVEHNHQAITEPVNPSSSMDGDQSKESTMSDSESDYVVVNHRTFSLLGSDFFCHMVSKMNSISKSCVVQCLETAEDWIAETPYSRELTVKDFCNNPLVMNVLLEFLNGYPDVEKLPKVNPCTQVFYDFPEDFQNERLFRMLQDYVEQILLRMLPPDFSPDSSLSSLSVLEFAFKKMPFRECAIMSLLFSKGAEVLKLADVAAKLNFVAMLVIFDEFRQRDIEG